MIQQQRHIRIPRVSFSIQLLFVETLHVFYTVCFVWDVVIYMYDDVCIILTYFYKHFHMRYIYIPFFPIPFSQVQNYLLLNFQSLNFLYARLFFSYIHLFFLFLQPCSYVYVCLHVDPYVFFENIHIDNNYNYNYYYFQYSFYFFHLLHSFLFHCHSVLLLLY